MNLIALTGSAGSGKTTASQLLIDSFGYKRMSFADPLKQIAKESFGWDGQKDYRGRRLLQVLGTDAGRAYNPEIWIDKMRSLILSYDMEQGRYMAYTNIVIDDIRFNNEANLVHEFGGKVILLEGASYYTDPSHELLASHPSEQDISRDHVDFFINMPNCKGDVNKFNDIFLREFLKIQEKMYDSL